MSVGNTMCSVTRTHGGADPVPGTFTLWDEDLPRPNPYGEIGTENGDETMDGLPHGADSQWSAPQKPRQITRPRADFLRAAKRPLNELTIRDLIVELGKVEDAQAHRLDVDRNNYSERYMSQREILIIAELHRRRSLAPTPWPQGDEVADALP